MIRVCKNIVFITIFALLCTNVSYAIDYDKKGRAIYEVTAPTKETEILYATISDALRKKIDVFSSHDVSKNIFSQNVIVPSEDKYEIATNSIAHIRHTSSIANLDGEKYELIHDEAAKKEKLVIFYNNYIHNARDGFYKIDGKIYYFDKNGYMVKGMAVDSEGVKYIFSGLSGELLEKILE